MASVSSRPSSQLQPRTNNAAKQVSIRLPPKSSLELAQENVGLTVPVITKHARTGDFVRSTTPSALLHPLYNPAEVPNYRTADRASSRTHITSASKNSSHRGQDQVSVDRSRTPTLYLSKRARGVASPSPSHRTDGTRPRSVRRKPAVIESFVSEQRQRTSGDQFAIHPVTEKSFYQEDDGDEDLLRPWYAGSRKQQAQLATAQLRDDRHAARSPGILSEVSVTPSLRYAESPFSLATALTSRTSCSPLYTTTPYHNTAMSSNSLTGVAWPPRTSSAHNASVQRSAKNSMVGNDDGIEATGRSPRNGLTPAVTTLLAEESAEYSERALSESAEQRLEYYGLKSGLPDFSKSARDSAVASSINAPPELAHLLRDTQISTDAGKANQSRNASGRYSNLINPISAEQVSTSPKLEDIVDGIVGCANNAVEASARPSPPGKSASAPMPPPLSQNHLDRTIHTERQIESMPSRSATADLNSLPAHSVETKPIKSRSSFGFWKRERENLNDRSTIASSGPLKVNASVPKNAAFNKPLSTNNSLRPLKISDSPLTGPRPTRNNPPLKTPSVDEFLANRLEPIYLRNAGPGNENGGPSTVSVSRISHNDSGKPRLGYDISRTKPLPPIPTVTREQVENSDALQNRADTSKKVTTERIPVSRAEAHVDRDGTKAKEILPANNREVKHRSRGNAKLLCWSLFPKHKQVHRIPGQQTSSSKTGLPAAQKKSQGTIAMKAQSKPPLAPNFSESLLPDHHARGRTPISTGQSAKSAVEQRTSQTPAQSSDPSRIGASESGLRRSSSLIRNSLDALSRSKSLVHRNQSRRGSKTSQDAQPSLDTTKITDRGTTSSTSIKPVLTESMQAIEKVEGWLPDATPQASADKQVFMDAPLVSGTETKSQRTETWSTAADTDMHTPAKPLLSKESRAHLSRVIEEEFFTFSANRSSMSSYSSSSGTFYFPVVPTRPPTASLPKIPDQYQSSLPPITTINVSESPALSVHENGKAHRRKLTPFPTIASTQRAIKEKKSETEFSNGPQNTPGNIVDNRSESVAARAQAPTKEIGAQPKTRTQRSQTNGLLSSRWDATAKALDADEVSMTDLRFASLMTSKWLSFGRVLFSPAHTAMKACKDEKILVIDGLGSDWSYYCALTYPHIKVHTLSLGSPSPNLAESIGDLKAPVNHCEDLRSDIMAEFPYADNTFGATVIRFPSATSEAVMHHLISECTRVLCPGGYMETSAIDLDLLRMGSRGRKCVRELKLRIHAADSDACLKPASDNIQLLLGRCGYEKLSRCIIGVPAVGLLTTSRPTSSDEKSRSFGELMKDNSERSDTGIVKMVSRVGRWWYSQCYEQDEGRASMWKDKRLLQECEELHTAFKLLVCYAQKPLGAKRKALTV